MAPPLGEPVGISPRVDCVFHAVLADPRHLDRLVDFLNAVLPADIDTPVLESAMAVLNDFKTNAARNNLYRARLEYIRVQNSIARDMAETKDRLEAAEARAEAERKKAEAEREARARLSARLRELGVDPDEV